MAMMVDFAIVLLSLPYEDTITWQLMMYCDGFVLPMYFGQFSKRQLCSQGVACSLTCRGHLSFMKLNIRTCQGVGMTSQVLHMFPSKGPCQRTQGMTSVGRVACLLFLLLNESLQDHLGLIVLLLCHQGLSLLFQFFIPNANALQQELLLVDWIKISILQEYMEFSVGQEQ